MYDMKGLTARDLRVIEYALAYYKRDGLPSDVSAEEMAQVSAKVAEPETVEEPKGLTELWLRFTDDGSGEPGTIGCLFPSEMNAAQLYRAVERCDFVERVSASGKPTMRQYFFS